jgi:hypothetical protein
MGSTSFRSTPQEYEYLHIRIDGIILGLKKSFFGRFRISYSLLINELTLLDIISVIRKGSIISSSRRATSNPSYSLSVSDSESFACLTTACLIYVGRESTSSWAVKEYLPL